MCTAHRTRGETVCANRYSAPMEGLHTEVVSTIREEGPEDRPGATTDARGVLHDLLNGRLIVTPTLIENARWFEFKGEATFGALLRGLMAGVNGMVAPGGTAHGLWWLDVGPSRRPYTIAGRLVRA